MAVMWEIFIGGIEAHHTHAHTNIRCIWCFRRQTLLWVCVCVCICCVLCTGSYMLLPSLCALPILTLIQTVSIKFYVSIHSFQVYGNTKSIVQNHIISSTEHDTHKYTCRNIYRFAVRVYWFCIHTHTHYNHRRIRCVFTVFFFFFDKLAMRIVIVYAVVKGCVRSHLFDTSNRTAECNHCTHQPYSVISFSFFHCKS